MTQDNLLSGEALGGALDDAAASGDSTPTEITSPCCGPCPPKYKEILDWADYLDRLAVQLETDDQAWDDAVADMILEGYNSEIARVGVHNYRDPNRPTMNDAAMVQYLDGELPENFFADDLSHYFIDFEIRQARPIIIKTIRNKASNARLIADSAIKYAEGKYEFDGTKGGAGEVQLYAYLCSKDPALITQGVWNALYHMGLIDFATWEDANYEVFSDFVFVASLATAVFTAGASLLLSARNLARRLFRAGAQDALRFGQKQLRRLQMLAKRQLALAPFRRTVRVYRVEGGGNAFFRVSESGKVALITRDRVLFLNGGMRDRAMSYLARRQGDLRYADSRLVSFRVPRSFIRELEESAIDERTLGLIKKSGNRAQVEEALRRPLIVDRAQAPLQFGLRPAQLEALERLIIQGTGRIE